MKEELTDKMHSEFWVNPEDELLHACITLWTRFNIDETHEDFESICNLMNVPVDYALNMKAYFMDLANE